MLDLSRLALFVMTRTAEGARLHQAALTAVHERRFDDAETLFEAAARRYRREIEVEPLARLRVHQMMAQVFACRGAGAEARDCLEVERRLCQLDRIESLEPPFELVEARSLLAHWYDGEGIGPAAETDLPELAARAA